VPNVYTRTGDKGTTGLFGSSRASKNDVRVEAYGTIDEAMSSIGYAYSIMDDEPVREILHNVEQRLFMLGAELASDEKGLSMLQDKISVMDIEDLEAACNEYLEIVGKQKEFVLPGKNPTSAALHIARTVVRRAERQIVTCNLDYGVRPEVLKYVNRLSDALFIFARYEAQKEVMKEITRRVIEKLEALDITITDEEKAAEIPAVPNEDAYLELAKKMAVAAEAKAVELGIPVVFSLVDGGGNLLYFERMKGALLASIDISMNKAYTANSLKLPTHVVADLVKEDGPLYGLQWTNNSRLVVFGGGFPITCGGEVCGGIGVSGGTVEQDMEIAQAALAVME
jgi:ATP:cob(I)alamin adenosyltransferase